MYRYHALDMLTYDKKNIVLKKYLKDIIYIDQKLKYYIDNPESEVTTPLSDFMEYIKETVKDPNQIKKYEVIHGFYDTCKKILRHVHIELTKRYTDDGELNDNGNTQIDALLTKFYTTFEINYPTKKEDIALRKLYFTKQIIYLFIKYDEKFSTLLLGHFRNIPHLQTEFNDTYPEQLIEIIKECIDDKRKSYKSFTDLLSDSTEIHPGITSTEHISNQKRPDDPLHCMGDLYEDLPDLMNRLLVCEFFDKNQHIYDDDQNYMIKRELRDKIKAGNKKEKKDHSDKIIGFSTVYGGITSKPKRYKYNESIFMFNINRKIWDEKNPLRKLYVKNNFNYNYKKYSYTDNKITAISTIMSPYNDKKSKTSKIDIKILHKTGKSATTKKGKKDKKQSSRGMVCRSGPDRMQIKPLVQNINEILGCTLNYESYLTQLDLIFTGSIRTKSKKKIGDILQTNIDGITTEGSFTIPEKIPIIHYEKKTTKTNDLYPYKPIRVKDLCIIISTLLRYKEYEPMFHQDKTFSIKWFYNTMQSNNKYTDLFNT